MRAVVHREFGKIVGVYWVDENVGFGYQEQAEAFLSIDGVARAYAFRDVTNSRGRVIGRQRCGSTADDIERGKHLDPDIRLALETEIIAAMQYDQARELARKERNSLLVDEYGNSAYEHE